jgi:hypothetical protein
MDQQLILLISFLGGTGIVLGLAVGLAFLKKGPQRWLTIADLGPLCGHGARTAQRWRRA